MIIWFVFALMTGVAILAVLAPLSRQPRAARGTADDTIFFREQIADIDRAITRGLMPAGEGEAARAEAGRRLLRAVAGRVTEGDQKGEPALRRRRAASTIAISLIPLVALTLYGAVGQPHAADAPLAGRMDLRLDDPEGLDIAAAVARVEAHLARRPDDARGWEVLAPIYSRIGRIGDAAHAYGEVLRLDGPTAARLADWGEALVMVEGGVVSATAREAFDRALAFDEGSGKAAFYRALAAEQDGDRAGALARLRDLAARTSADAPWRPMLLARIAMLERLSIEQNHLIDENSLDIKEMDRFSGSTKRRDDLMARDRESSP